MRGARHAGLGTSRGLAGEAIGAAGGEGAAVSREGGARCLREAAQIKGSASLAARVAQGVPPGVVAKVDLWSVVVPSAVTPSRTEGERPATQFPARSVGRPCGVNAAPRLVKATLTD